MTVDKTEASAGLPQSIIVPAGDHETRIDLHQSALSRHLQMLRAKKLAKPKYHHTVRQPDYV